MKKIIVICCASLAALIALAYVAITVYGGDYIASMIEDGCKSQFGSAPQFKGKISLGLVPPRIETGKVNWRPRIGGYDMDLAIGSLAATLDLPGLLSGRLHIDEAEIGAPRVRLVPASGGAQKLTQASSTAMPVEIGRLIIQNGEVEYAANGEIWLFKNMKLLAENVQPSRGGDIKGDFTVSIQGKDEAPIDINVALKGNIHYYMPNLTLRQTSVTLTFLNESALAALSPASIALDGAFNLSENTFRIQDGMLTTPQGSLKIKGESGAKFGAFNGAISLNAQAGGNSILISSPLAMAWPRISLPEMAIKINDAAGEGQLAVTIPASPAPVSCAGKFTMGVINWKSGVQEDKSGGGSEGMSILHDLDLEASIAGIKYEKLFLKNIRGQLKGKNGEYELSNLALNWENGAIRAKGALSLPQWAWHLDSEGDKIDFGLALKNFGVDGFDNGLAKFQARLNATGNAPELVAASISGDGSLSVEGVRMEIVEELAKAMSFFGGNPVNAEGISVSAPFVAKDGNIVFKPVKCMSRFISANGQVDLDFNKNRLDSLIDFKIGKLDVPLTIAGPFGHISVGVDRDAPEH